MLKIQKILLKNYKFFINDVFITYLNLRNASTLNVACSRYVSLIDWLINFSNFSKNLNKFATNDVDCVMKNVSFVTRILLESPYETHCFDYRTIGFENRLHAIDNCTNSLSFRYHNQYYWKTIFTTKDTYYYGPLEGTLGRKWEWIKWKNFLAIIASFLFLLPETEQGVKHLHSDPLRICKTKNGGLGLQKGALPTAEAASKQWIFPVTLSSKSLFL